MDNFKETKHYNIHGKFYTAEQMRECYREITGLNNDGEFSNEEIYNCLLAALYEEDDDCDGTAPFGDETRIVLPDESVDCSYEGFFDETEYSCWNLIKEYADLFGVKIVPECPEDFEDDEDNEPISFDMAKSVQDFIIDLFKKAGVTFEF